MDVNYTNNINKTINENNINISLIQNTTVKEIFVDNTSSKLLFLGIIFILLVLLIISILILLFLFLKKKKVITSSNHNMILNKIILKNPKNNISLNVNPKDFQRLQNTSNVSNSNIQPNNKILFNEIKSENLKDEIHKIINTSSSLDSGRRKRKRITDSESNKKENKEQNVILEENDNNKEMSEIIKEDNNKEKNEDKPNLNTQELEQEIKEQIKKYVIEEHNI